MDALPLQLRCSGIERRFLLSFDILHHLESML